MASKRRKKGCLYGLVLAFLVAAGVEAQGYPPEFSGAMLPGQVGPLDAAINLIEYQNVPYSMPGLYEYEWVGSFEGYPTGCWLDLDYLVRDGRIIGDAPMEWSNGRMFYWDPEMRAYARLAADPEVPWLIRFEVITINYTIDSGVYRQGVFEYSGSPPQWWVVSSFYPYWIYELKPYETMKLMQPNIVD